MVSKPRGWLQEMQLWSAFQLACQALEHLAECDEDIDDRAFPYKYQFD